MRHVRLQRYPAYKDSGVEWIGEIPDGWEVTKLKNISKIVNGATPSSSVPSNWEGDVLWVTPAEINNILFLKSSVRKITTKGLYSCGTSLVPEGSIILTTRAPIGKTAIAAKELCTNQGCKSIVVKSGIPSFLNYQIASQTKVLNSLGKGTTFMELGNSELKNFLIPFPPLAEQTAIANFLDEKCGKIDVAVAQKEKMVELLKERKQIVIQNAVTKGLNPNAKMKDSGVEWIGEIPDHWETKRAKYLFFEANDRTIDGTEELLSVSHMTGVTSRSEKDVNMFLAEDYTGSKLCKKGDVVYNIMWAWMGALGVSGIAGIVSPSYGVYRPFKQNSFNPFYLEELLKGPEYVTHYNKVSTGLHSSRLRFYAHMFFNMEIGFPSKVEQDKIVEYIQIQTNKIDKAIALQQQLIEKLKEYKATLINSAVTGKIKVNGNFVTQGTEVP
ncbi:restriction endonuclease subunit S [bacterium]|nr:restriction endonuclease subunit S [bacterium]